MPETELLSALLAALDAGTLTPSEFATRLQAVRGDHSEELEAWFADRSVRARELLRAGAPDRAIAISRESVLLGERLSAPVVAGIAGLDLGLMYAERGITFDAMEAYAQATRALNEIGADEPPSSHLAMLRVEARLRWAQAAIEDHRHEIALSLTEEALSEARAATALDEALARWLRGRALAGRYRHVEAETEFRRAVELRKLPGDVRAASAAARDMTPPLAAMLIALGRTVRDAGRIEASLEHFQAAEQLAARDCDDARRAMAMSEIAYTHLQLGRMDFARVTMAEAAVVADAAGLPTLAQRWRTQLDLDGSSPRTLSDGPIDSPSSAYSRSADAERLHHEGRFTELLPLAEELRSWAATARDNHLRMTTANLVGICLLKSGRPIEASGRFREAIEAGERLNQELTTLGPRANLAHAYHAAGQVTGAIAVLNRAHEIAEHLLFVAETGAVRQQVLAVAASLYDHFIAIVGHSPENDFQVLQASELTRGRVLRGWMRAQELAAARPATALPESVEQALEDLRRAEVAVEVARTGTPNPVPAEFIRRVKESGDRVAALVGADAFDGRLHLHRISSMREGLEAGLTVGDGALFLYSGSHHLHLTVVWRSPRGLHSKSKVVRGDRADRAANLGRWFSECDVFQRRGGPTQNQNAWRGTTVLASYDAMTRVFDAELFEPLTELLSHAESSISRLCIVPHAEIGLLPWWSLADRFPSISRLTVAVSWDVFRICGRRERALDGPCAILCDPTGTLPNAAPEADLVQSIWPHGTLSAGGLKARLANATLLHISAHGTFDRTNPLLSGLVLGLDQRDAAIVDRYLSVPGFKPVDGPGASHFRVLTVADCLGALSLPHCRLAVLSACDSGVPRVHGGGEMVGLPMALLVAGARSVVASLWPVCDSASFVMMRTLYGRLAAGEPSPSCALHAARMALRAVTRREARGILGPRAALPDGDLPFAHPVFSDVFQCFGAW